MWPEDLPEDYEYILASAILGRRARRQLRALEALMGRPLTHAELAKEIQGDGSRATVTNTVKALHSKGLIQTGVTRDLKTTTYALTRIGARVLLVAHEQMPHRRTFEAFERGLVPA